MLCRRAYGPHLEVARAFYSEIDGLKVADRSPPGAVVFDMKPIPFAARLWSIWASAR